MSLHTATHFTLCMSDMPGTQQRHCNKMILVRPLKSVCIHFSQDTIGRTCLWDGGWQLRTSLHLSLMHFRISYTLAVMLSTELSAYSPEQLEMPDLL